MNARPDRLGDVVDAVIDALDESLDGRALAVLAGNDDDPALPSLIQNQL